VYSDRVILDRGGALESLALPRQSAPGAAPPALPPLAASGGNPIAERVRRLVEENPSAVGDIMRPQPVFAQGKQRGYRVYPGRNRAAFVQLGLRPGDLVTAINGTPLDDPARGEEIFRTIGSQPEVRVSVTRNGRQQELVLNMAQAASAADQLAGMEGMAPIDPAPPPGEPVESE
jgi:general secretion pathway protein C